MAKQMNYRRPALRLGNGYRTLTEESERRLGDAAARWLARHDGEQRQAVYRHQGRIGYVALCAMILVESRRPDGQACTVEEKNADQSKAGIHCA